MELNREKWNEVDVVNYSKLLLTYSKGEEKSKWEKRIVNTSLPCIAVPSTIVDSFAKQISTGNYRQFLDIMPMDNLSESLVVGKVINRIKNVDDYICYLEKYIYKCDSWAQTDILKYPIKESNESLFWNKAREYLISPTLFVRRCGLLILMKGFLQEKYIEDVLMLLDTMINENEYYVLMMIAWLLCEAVIKCRDKTIKYIKECKHCDFVINKAISKCSDSYRITQADKNYLKSLRRKNVCKIQVNKLEYC